MKPLLAILFALIAGGACAQTPDAAYQARFAVCLQEARVRHYEEFRYNLFMRRCMHNQKDSPAAIERIPVPPTPPAPAATPPTTSPSAPKLSPRALSCNEMIADAGMKGTAAQQFLQRCLAATH